MRGINKMDIDKALDLANEEMTKHNLSDWYFKFDRAARRFGVCNYTKKRISLSYTLTELNSEEKVLDTIRHEIAHALVGVHQGHNYIWRRKALEIGCNGKRCYSSEDTQTPTGKYQLKCDTCGQVINRHKMTKHTLKTACGICCKKYNYGQYSTQYLMKMVNTNV